MWIEGTYLTLRPSFGELGAIYAYRTDIVWDGEHSSLIFRESERSDSDFTQYGSVAVPNQSGHIYLVTNRHGQYRLITVSRPTITGEMHGILTTLLAGRGSQLTPIAAPIAFVPIASVPDAGVRADRWRPSAARPVSVVPEAHARRTFCDVCAGGLKSKPLTLAPLFDDQESDQSDHQGDRKHARIDAEGVAGGEGRGHGNCHHDSEAQF